ncbi:gp53-like domain-containing protein [Megasphaera stantonii]|uniref:gp53-like domain-containing protein n=1 Tax=Megasphaera stantonii TaxID=2144175 RepID=UPI003B968035
MGHGWHGCFWADSKQWGLGEAIAEGGYISFPTSFIDNAYGVVVTHVNANSTPDPRMTEVTYISTTRFYIKSSGTSAGGIQYYYLSIGK